MTPKEKDELLIRLDQRTEAIEKYLMGHKARHWAVELALLIGVLSWLVKVL